MPIRNGIQLHVLLLVLAFFALIPTHTFAAEESITVTTYYPSPYGVYSEMRLYPKLVSEATTCDDPNDEGLMFYDKVMHAMRVCRCINTSCILTTDFTYSATNYWTLSGTSLYPNDLAWNVGIGTTSPKRKLEISGNNVAHGAAIRFSRQPASTDSAVLEVMDPGGINAAWSLGNKGTNNELFKIYSGTGGNDRFMIDVNAGTTILNPSGGNTQIGFISAPPAPARLSVSGNVAIGGSPFINNAPPANGIIVEGNVGIGTTGPSVPLHIASSASGAIRIADGSQAAGRVLTSDANGVGTWQPPGGGGMSNIRVFTASGTFAVPAGITKLWVEVYGGGGAGGPGHSNIYNSGGAGGGAGGVAMGFVTVSPGQSIAVTVGGGGVPTASCNGAGGSGGTSSFGAFLSATGGGGGQGGSGNFTYPGAGGYGNGGSINLRGGGGTYGLSICDPNGVSCTVPTSIAGVGGSNTLGIGGTAYTMAFSQNDGGNFGGGGAGEPAGTGMGVCMAGGAGGSGGVIIWY